MDKTQFVRCDKTVENIPDLQYSLVLQQAPRDKLARCTKGCPKANSSKGGYVDVMVFSRDQLPANHVCYDRGGGK